MYRRGDFLVTMSNGAVAGDGSAARRRGRPADAGAGALVAVLDVRDPARAQTVATFKVPGEIADSRIVGDVLYLATYENAACYGCGTGAAHDGDDASTSPTRPRSQQVDQVVVREQRARRLQPAVGSTHWKRSIIVTDQRLYIGGHADVDPTSSATADEGIIDVLDITDPTGRLRRGARITSPAPILSRWQMDEHDGVLRVISQRGAGRTGNGDRRARGRHVPRSRAPQSLRAARPHDHAAAAAGGAEHGALRRRRAPTRSRSTRPIRCS